MSQRLHLLGPPWPAEQRRPPPGSPRSPRSSTSTALVALCFSILAACSGSPKTTFHTLGIDKHAASAQRVESRVKSLGVGPVELPALLDRSGVVLRKDAYTVELSQTHEWGGRLQDELLRALARYLQRRLPRVRVLIVPWETEQAPQVQLTLSLDQFDGEPDGDAVLRGRWVLQDPRDGRSIAAGNVTLKEQVRGSSVRAVVEAQTRLVVKLGDLVIRKLQ